AAALDLTRRDSAIGHHRNIGCVLAEIQRRLVRRIAAGGGVSGKMQQFEIVPGQRQDPCPVRVKATELDGLSASHRLDYRASFERRIGQSRETVGRCLAWAAKCSSSCG